MTDYRAPWDAGPAPGRPALPSDRAAPPRPRGRRPAAARLPAPGEKASPGWLYHHLTASGPAEPLAAFVAAARGPGTVPWQLDLAALEEDVFNLAVAQPPARRRLGAEGCRVLARQFRAQVEAHQARAAARAGHGHACPFDLHALLPVPDSILRQGPAHPAALAWLSEHWGTTDRLRHVALRPGATAGRRLPRGHGIAGYGFFASGGTPRAALAQLGPRWPALRFVLQPRPAG